MKHSMSDSVFHNTALATPGYTKLIICQNTARQQFTIMENITHRGPRVSKRCDRTVAQNFPEIVQDFGF